MVFFLHRKAKELSSDQLRAVSFQAVGLNPGAPNYKCNPLTTQLPCYYLIKQTGGEHKQTLFISFILFL